jgi:hypothetical protein
VNAYQCICKTGYKGVNCETSKLKENALKLSLTLSYR